VYHQSLLYSSTLENESPLAPNKVLASSTQQAKQSLFDTALPLTLLYNRKKHVILCSQRCHVPTHLNEQNPRQLIRHFLGEIVPLRVRVDLLPKPPYQGVVVLIDVLRTCTTAAMLFERGLVNLDIIDKLKLARQRAESTGATLLGERAGLPPEGFNYGNSLAEIRSITLGSNAVTTSENAPQALAQLEGADILLLGSLYNADAVAKTALQHSKGEIFLVCSGFLGQEDLDDTLTAGYLAARLKTLEPTTILEGASQFAISLMKAFPDPLQALWRSSTGQYLRSLSMEEDVAIASDISQTEHVPVLKEHQNTEQGHIFSFVSSLSLQGSQRREVVAKQ
jgi:2-phosphosulfolactate phosphatase